MRRRGRLSAAIRRSPATHAQRSVISIDRSKARAATSAAADVPRVGRAIAGAFAAVLLWAGYYLVTRFGVTRTLTVDDLVAARYVVPAALLLPVALRLGISRRGIGGLVWPKILALSATGGLSFGWFVTVGLQYAPAAQASIFTSASVPLCVVLLAWPFLGEAPRTGQIAGVLLILAGDVLVVSNGLSGGTGETKGQILFALAGLGWAIYTILVRRWRIDGVIGTVVISVVSGVVFVPYYLLLGHSTLDQAPIVETIVQFFYMGGLVGIGATLAYTAGVKVLGAQRVALTTALVPACVTLLAIPFLGEIPSWAESAGVAAVTAGMPFALGWRPGRAKAVAGAQKRPSA